MDVASITRTACLLPICAALATGALADGTLYRVNSKDVGWSTIDITIDEIRRDERVSSLRIPHYEKRSAVESRFAMCVFTGFATRRGFETWLVSGDVITDDVVRVGFLKSSSEDAAKLLGKEFLGKDALRADVAVMNRMCGIHRAK